MGLLVVSLAHAQEGSLPPADVGVGQGTIALEDVEVTARREALRTAVTAFVTNLSPRDGTQMARWHGAICPWVGGASPEQGDFIVARILEIANAVGAETPQAGSCGSNLLVFLTDQPGQLIAQLNARDQSLFGGASSQSFARFAASLSPVRVWQNAPLENSDGSPPVVDSNKPAQYRLEDSRIISGVTTGLAAAIVIVDTTKARAATIGQLADYLAMVVLARIDADAEFGDAPSILRLFGLAGPGDVPGQVTDWDTAFLKAVYGMRDTYLQERSVITTRMLQQLEALESDSRTR